MPLLDGRTAVVTGGAQGIGFAIAERYVAEGARVVIGDLDPDATAAAVERLGGRDVAAAVRCDVTSAAEVEALIAAAVDMFGGLDVMVNNAGITRDATMRKMTEEQFLAVIRVNLGAAYELTTAAIPRFADGASVVSLASRAYLGNFGQFNYSASKGGLVGMTRALALQLAPRVRVNAIAPSLTASEMTSAMPER